MHDVLGKNTHWLERPSNFEGTDPQPAVPPMLKDTGMLCRIIMTGSRSWGSIVRRAITSIFARLPARLQYRLKRLLNLTGSDMGDIEHDYQAWIRLYDHEDANTRRRIVAELARMKHTPLISVLMPVFNPSPEHLQAAIHSVQDQYYPWWELCIGDDASTNQNVSKILRNAAEGDHRIKLVRRDQNGHISAASNSALRLATGSFVALLDHDDVLPPNALYEVAARINTQPDVDIIYSDEDHIDNTGRRSHPYFKSDWNPELILGQNLISHLGVYRRALVESIGGFRTGFEGSQDHDLALRMVTETRPERIAHIPKVLYHWRQGALDRTFSEGAHERCVINGRRAIREFVTQTQPIAQVGPAAIVPAWTRVTYPVPDPAPLVSVILFGSNNIGDQLITYIDDLLKRTEYPALEILVVTEATTTSNSFASDARVRWLDYRSGSLNQAAQQARGHLFLLLNANLNPNHSDWLREMVSHALRSDVGAVGAKILGTKRTIEHAGIALGGQGTVFYPFAGQHRSCAGYFGYLQLVRDVTAVSDSCLLMRRDVFLDCGGFDDVLEVNALKDVDLCLKLADAGYRVLWTPYAELCFREETAAWDADAAKLGRGTARLRQRWKMRLNNDPFWSPNLAHRSGRIGLAFPPRTDEQPYSTSRPLMDAKLFRSPLHDCAEQPDYSIVTIGAR